MGEMLEIHSVYSDSCAFVQILKSCTDVKVFSLTNVEGHFVLYWRMWKDGGVGGNEVLDLHD